MKQFFSTARIKFNELYTDVIDFTMEKYKQSGSLFSIGSAWGQVISVINQLSQLIFFYIEDSITESNINTAQRTQNIAGLARLTGHNATRAISATGEVTITFNGQANQVPNSLVILPNQTRIKCQSNGLTYMLDLNQTEIRIPLTTNRQTNVKIIQGTFESQTFTATGESLQSYTANMSANKLIENFNVHVFVDSEEWKLYESLYDMPFNAKGAIVKTGLTGGLDIYFGNNFSGKIPTVGSEIRVEYIITDATKGELELDNNISWQFLDVGYDQFGNEVDLNSLLNIRLSMSASFSANPETPELTKLLAPKVSQSLILAREENYIYFFEKFNIFSIIDAWTTSVDNSIVDDNVIFLLLIPDVRKKITSNENYFTTQISDFTLSNTDKTKALQLLDDSKQTLVTSVVNIVDPVVSKYIMHINLIIFEGYNEDTIKEQIVDKLSNYFVSLRRRDRIPKSDLIPIIESIEGIDSINLYFLGENNELSKALDPLSDDIGLDDFGDIIIDKDEVVLIRGGFSDRNGVFYSDVIDFNNPSIVNINIKQIVPLSFNTRLNQQNITNIINGN